VIIAVEEAHHVGGDELALVRIGTDDVELIFLVAAPGVGDEAFPTDEEAGIAIGGAVLRDGDGDLRPVGVGLAPVGSGPAGVEVVERVVVIFKPPVELGLVCGAVGFVGVLVVDLPADDVGVVAETFGKALGDVAGKFAVLRVGPVELLAIAVLVTTPVFLDAEGFWVIGGEPRGRRGAGGSDDNGDVVAGGGADGAVEPVEIVMAFGGLEGRPGELADANEADVGGLHEGEVGVPTGFGPLLWIPGGAEIDSWGCGGVCLGISCQRCGMVGERARGRGEREAGDERQEEWAESGHELVLGRGWFLELVEDKR